MIFKCNFFINSPVEKIYDLLFEIKKWPDLLPHCKAIKVLSETPNKQHYLIDIRNGKNIEEIDTIRTFKKNEYINFSGHHAKRASTVFDLKWQFKSVEKGTLIESCYELKSTLFFEKIRSLFVWQKVVKSNILLIFGSVQLALNTTSKTIKNATYLEHSIDISLPVDEAFDTICNPKSWPTLFPTAININVIRETPDLIEFELVEYLGKKEFFSHIHFHINREKNMIYYQHYPPTFPFKHMISRWFLIDIGYNRTRFIIAREYQLQIPIIGDILAKTIIKKVIIDHVRDYHNDLKMFVKIANAKKWFENKEKYLIG